MRVAFAIACITVGVACLPCPAQESSRPAAVRLAERFRQLDRNADGKVSAEEYPGPLFGQMDSDADGFLTLEEATRFLRDRRAAGSAATQPGSAVAAPARWELGVVDAVFELCVHDVEACARFYRDGIGMREVEPADADKGALLEWAGCYLRLRKVPGDKPAPATGNPMTQMLASNGFRWFSLWFQDPAAVAERLAKAGYPEPVKGANVYLTRDPENNVVELMGIPRSASAETFTWGMGVSDEAAALEFYREVLSLGEFDPWDLPPPFSMKMYLFSTGAGRIKFASPRGQRPKDADAGAGAPGLRSVTLRVADLAAAREGLLQRGATIAGNGRLLVTDPDGNRFYIEQAPLEAAGDEAMRQAGRAAPMPGQPAPASRSDLLARYSSITPQAHEERVTEQRPGEPPLKRMPDNDATRDAAGRGQLFESIVVPGFTSIQEGMNGLAIADLNRDGLLDIVATYSARRGTATAWGTGEKLRVFINKGDFRYRQHLITILDSQMTPEAFGRGQVPVLADFNGDGLLDLFVTRHAQMSAGQSNPGDQRVGNGLYVSDGAWDVFRDVSEEMGIQNEKAYNRQPSIGDVNRDGWLDIAIGCDNIGNAMGGFPHSRLYVFRPDGPDFEDGRFEDIGGTDLVPDFGGFYHDSARDKAGPDINLRDLDNDGDLDLIQSYHVDIRDPAMPFSPVEYRQGVFCWKNLLAETGSLRFDKVTDNGLACEARLTLNDDKKTVTPVGTAPGLPYISLADVDRDGLMDVLAVGPASPGWAPRTEYVSGRFWLNKGKFQFQEATDAAGLSALNWVYRDWCRFFAAPMPQARPMAQVNPADRRPYFADAVFGDFDNDGWVDFVVLDRGETQNLPSRATLFLNRGDGSFEPKPTTFSGLDGSGICGEAADLNGDGLLDLVFAADPDNSGIASGMDRYESKVYWNTGLHGARENHWLRLRFRGVKDAELIGSRVLVYESGQAGKPDAKPIGMRSVHPNHSYKSGGALEVHFGLGQSQSVDVMVVLANGASRVFRDIRAGRLLEVDLENHSVSAVPVAALR